MNRPVPRGADTLPREMSAELIAIAGPLLGECFALKAAELRMGRAPAAQIHIEDNGVAWNHCAVRPVDGGWSISDCHTGTGTYVNGMKVREQMLEPGDQIAVGDSIFAYRDAAAAPDEAPTQPTLLRACSLLFLFRALAICRDDRQRTMLEEQIVALVGDLVPLSGGAVRLGRDLPPVPGGAVLIPLHVRTEPAGTLAAWFPPEESANLSD